MRRREPDRQRERTRGWGSESLTNEVLIHVRSFLLFILIIFIVICLDVHNAPSKQRWKNPIKKSPIINWAMHKKTTGSSTKSNSIDVQSPGK